MRDTSFQQDPLIPFIGCDSWGTSCRRGSIDDDALRNDGGATGGGDFGIHGGGICFVAA